MHARWVQFIATRTLSLKQLRCLTGGDCKSRLREAHGNDGHIILLLYHSGHYRKPSGREEILAVQCPSSRITPDTNFNQDICAALIPQICARMTDDAASAPYRKTNGYSSVVKAAVRATGYLVPIKLSIALGRGSQWNRHAS